MEITQRRWTAARGWSGNEPSGASEAQLVLVFGATAALTAPLVNELRARYPRAKILGCSTAGEISGIEVTDDSVVTTAVRFEHTTLHASKVRLADAAGSFEAGKRVALALPKEGLTHVLVLSDGLKVNGSDLVDGMMGNLPPAVAVTGGLAGDGARFEKTLTLLDGDPEEGLIAAIGFYGTRLKIGYGSLGGWDPFGPKRLITRSKGNVLFELDGQSALGLYKKYLGTYAAGLPATGLLFPLSLRVNDGTTPVVRTILATHEEDQSLTFAGDVPEGAYVRLMKANFERLIDGAIDAAKATYAPLDEGSPELAILISCVGRKLVLKQRIEEEVEGVRGVLGTETVLAGFYSYGEIAPFHRSTKCELHNQTMTITTFSEK